MQFVIGVFPEVAVSSPQEAREVRAKLEALLKTDLVRGLLAGQGIRLSSMTVGDPYVPQR